MSNIYSVTSESENKRVKGRKGKKKISINSKWQLFCF